MTGAHSLYDIVPEAVLELGCDLGEGPLWDAASATLVFVDSNAGRIFRYDPVSGALARIEAGGVIGTAVPRRSGGFAASSTDGVVAVAEPDGATRLLVPIESDRATRMNDAKCDSRGRMLSGTLSMPFARGANALYRIDPDLSVHRLADGITVSNGVAWSPDERLLYYVDTSSRGIDVFDYDIATGAATGRRRFAEIDRADGFPDGMAVDAEGHVWVALYLGGRVRRFAPDGRVAGEIRLPVSGVTSCNFGGPDLTDLYITTARHGVPDDRLAAEPLAGALFRCRPGVAGLPSHSFAG